METHKLDTETHVFFYEQDFYVLSNFSSFNLQAGSLTFPTSEHAYHWCKFQLTEPHVAHQVAFAKSAHDSLKIAHTYKHLVRPDWENIKVPTMLSILRAKVTQHSYVCKKLLETRTRTLVEDSWRDSFWGWGEDKTGDNILGELWMRVRYELNSGQLDSSKPITNLYTPILSVK
jgi:ribA/ribD-fused uncharacterized protein